MQVELSTCNAAIQAATRAGDTGLAHEMLQEMRALDVRPVPRLTARDKVCREMVRCFPLSVRLVHAFDPAQCTGTWHTFLMPIALRCSDAVEICRIFRDLLKFEDQISYIGLLTSASNARNLAAAEAFLAEAKADGLGKAAIYAPVISCAAKSGNVAIAEQLGSSENW